MRQLNVYNSGRLAGVLTETIGQGYTFRYSDEYFSDQGADPISLTLPKTCQEYHSEHLFPFFANMLSEGHNRTVQARLLHLDEEDDFGILSKTCQVDTPGTITVKPLQNGE